MYSYTESDIPDLLELNKIYEADLLKANDLSALRYKLSNNYRILKSLYYSSKNYPLAAYYVFKSFEIDGTLFKNLISGVEDESASLDKPEDSKALPDFLLGLQYYYGLGKKKNLNLAYHCFKLLVDSSEEKNSSALLMLGMVSEPIDKKLAAKSLQSAAELGNSRAQVLYADAIKQIVGEEQQCQEYLNKAAAQGDCAALTVLSSYSYKSDKKISMQLTEEAAKQKKYLAFMRLAALEDNLAKKAAYLRKAGESKSNPDDQKQIAEQQIHKLQSDEFHHWIQFHRHMLTRNYKEAALCIIDRIDGLLDQEFKEAGINELVLVLMVNLGKSIKKSAEQEKNNNSSRMPFSKLYAIWPLKLFFAYHEQSVQSKMIVNKCAYFMQKKYEILSEIKASTIVDQDLFNRLVSCITIDLINVYSKKIKLLTYSPAWFLLQLQAILLIGTRENDLQIEEETLSELSMLTFQILEITEIPYIILNQEQILEILPFCVPKLKNPDLIIPANLINTCCGLSLEEKNTEEDTRKRKKRKTTADGPTFFSQPDEKFQENKEDGFSPSSVEEPGF